MTSVILQSNCQSWANVQDSLSDKGDNAYALVLYQVNAIDDLEKVRELVAEVPKSLAAKVALVIGDSEDAELEEACSDLASE